MMKALHDGENVSSARAAAVTAMERLRAGMIAAVNSACDDARTLLVQRTVNMDKADKLIGLSFRPTTPVNEALNAATAALRKMRE
ncbi:hypothetical protein [Paracraurococcus lichenis]|uniref:Uncharacterized protein n=1 Tax=Paracraurococcus lichenis TaxID=3064888 RepID=A0ABT9EDR8_9PROT|nr:hypothetical protein [Paracraurococcus sp. LOR1-02]MDO9714221.1 hypothetical protein [Paracraurococcus sp. LOR1-02]